MERTLYLECSAGISGDMTVAALLDLGADETVLREVLDSIPVGGYSIEIGRVKKAGIDCCNFTVKLDGEADNHDSDMEYLHGHGHAHGHDHGHGHSHRGIAEIREILSRTHLTDRAAELADRIFGILAEAEAKAHGIPVEQVHFHEVGAVDSIVDIVAAAVCMDNLAVTEVIVPKLCEGTGTVRCQHGVLPVPVPAVSNLAEQYRIPLQIMDMQGEFVTPTGAAIVAAVRTSSRLPETFLIEKTGIGAGKRQYERPSILRAMLISGKEGRTDTVWKLESNVDDCTGEALGHVMDCLLEAGARDVHYTPVYMKKNRPGWQINVLCDEGNVSRMEEILFLETTTIGVRKQRMERSTLVREQKTATTSLGDIEVKICQIGDRKRCYPEYESIARICREQGIPYVDVYRMVQRELEEFDTESICVSKNKDRGV